jgi:hypothetical protein
MLKNWSICASYKIEVFKRQDDKISVLLKGFDKTLNFDIWTDYTSNTSIWKHH